MEQRGALKEKEQIKIKKKGVSKEEKGKQGGRRERKIRSSGRKEDRPRRGKNEEKERGRREMMAIGMWTLHFLLLSASVRLFSCLGMKCLPPPLPPSSYLLLLLVTETYSTVEHLQPSCVFGVMQISTLVFSGRGNQDNIERC